MKRLSLYLLMVSLFFSCKKQDAPPDPVVDPVTTLPKGRVTGKIVAANNKTAVRNAVVFIAHNARIYHTYTDVNGQFNLEAPAGNQVLNIQAGSGRIFRTQLNVQVIADQVTAVASNAITLTQVATLAYVPGTYDKIEAILMDSLGYTATMINSSALHSVSALSQFNAVFINCSSNMQVDWLQDSVLATYVANGGSLYTSDYAVATLIGTYGGSCPGPRPGGFIPDAKLCTQRIGTVGMLYNAPLVSSSLQTYLNKNQMDVKFDLGAWESVMNHDTAFWEVMVRHPVSQAPLLIRTNSFTNGTAGTVSIGSSANNNMVTICHKPSGTTPVTITIPAADLGLHLAHGDTQGSCQSANGAGRIYYTTFHTQPNGLISPDMKHILDYIILNL